MADLYLDESGSEDASHFLFAGYLAEPAVWAQFSLDWRSALADHGLRGAFHGVEVWNRSGEFADWNSERVARLNFDLLLLIRDSAIYPVAASIELAAFGALPYGERVLLTLFRPRASRRLRQDYPRPYFLAFNSVLSVAKGKTEAASLNVVLAKHQQFGRGAEADFSLLREAWAMDDAELGSIRLAEPIDEPALQAADFLAYLLFRQESRDQADLTDAERRMFATLVKSAEDIRGIDAPVLQAMLDLHGPEMRRIATDLPDGSPLWPGA